MSRTAKSRSRRSRTAPTLQALWHRTVAADPGARALIDATTGRTWSRAELAAAGEEWARRHRAHLAGRRVLFAESNGPEWLRIFLGLLASDAIAVALDPGEPLAAQRSLATVLHAECLWHDGRLEPLSSPHSRTHPGVRLLKVTSGSTGLPRALPFSDAQMTADGRQICRTMGIRPHDLNLGCIPFGHSYGLGNLILPLLLQGTPILSGLAVLPQALAAGIAQWRPTVFPAVPALLRGLAEADLEPAHLGSLRLVISAGAPLAPEVAQAFRRKFGVSVHSFYGSSETGGITYDRTGQAALTGRSVGRPLAGVTLRFVSGGRFWVESAAVGGAGRFRPADRGVLTARGELFLLGRAGRMLKLAGRRVDPGEVECALRSLPEVTDAFVDVHPERPDALAAVVASTATSGQLRDALRPRLAAWKIPRKFVILPTLPLSPRGKLDTRQLRALLADPPAAEPDRV